MLNNIVSSLLDYALNNGLVLKEDETVIQNRLLDAFNADEFTRLDTTDAEPINKILEKAVTYACEKGIIAKDSITEADLFDTKLMGILTPLPSVVNAQFKEKYSISPESATDFFYDFSQKVNYIRNDRIKRDIRWKYSSHYGELDITINLSKPEKDPKAIAAALNTKASGYPKCLLCVENEGYRGRINHPARQNHRIIPLKLCSEKWGLQYSPYTYYNEHCIVFNKKHTPMKTDSRTFEKLLSFVELFPHYFVGSNADLPIVGGSILTHEHFQGGRYDFAMAKADNEFEFTLSSFDDIKASVVRWPMSVIRLKSQNKQRLAMACDYINEKWKSYNDESADIRAFTDGTPHNCITPIARKNGDLFEMDLVLRNNRTTDEYPDGIFHPHKELHHIKKENIGLIEVMGLAVLPARLKEEMKLVSDALINGKDINTIPAISHHAVWADEIKGKYTDLTDIDSIIHNEIGRVFENVLTHAGVFKRTQQGIDAFRTFTDSL